MNADAEAVAALKGVFEQWRVRQPGEIRRRDHSWEYDLAVRESAWGLAVEGIRRPPSRRVGLHRRVCALSRRRQVGAAPTGDHRHRRRASCPQRCRVRLALAVPRRDGLGGEDQGGAPHPDRKAAVAADECASPGPVGRRGWDVAPAHGCPASPRRPDVRAGREGSCSRSSTGGFRRTNESRARGRAVGCHVRGDGSPRRTHSGCVGPRRRVSRRDIAPTRRRRFDVDEHRSALSPTRMRCFERSTNPGARRSSSSVPSPP